MIKAILIFVGVCYFLLAVWAFRNWKNSEED